MISTNYNALVTTKFLFDKNESFKSHATQEKFPLTDIFYQSFTS